MKLDDFEKIMRYHFGILNEFVKNTTKLKKALKTLNTNGTLDKDILKALETLTTKSIDTEKLKDLKITWDQYKIDKNLIDLIEDETKK